MDKMWQNTKTALVSGLSGYLIYYDWKLGIPVAGLIIILLISMAEVAITTTSKIRKMEKDILQNVK